MLHRKGAIHLQNSTQNIAFSGYVIEKQLKESERGRVFLVREEDSRTRYIYRTFCGSGEVYKRMLSIDCRYLPKILKVLEEGGNVHVLEEYIQGDNLAFLLEGPSLTEQQAGSIVSCVCRALQVLHGIGAVHRDVKPENIILRGSDAVLIDFDASRFSNPTGSSDTQVMGTTGYAAPEQYGFSQTDARADIYALGILLNELLTKQHPSRFLAEGGFRPIIQKCTQINPEHRYRSVAEIIYALEHPPKRAGKGALAAFGALAVLLVFAAGVIFAGGFFADEASSDPAAEPQNSLSSEETAEDEAEVLQQNSDEDVDGFGRSDMGVQITAEEVEISMEPWEGSTEGFSTPFRCDLDGDGKPEDYVFGISFVNTNHGSIVTKDRNGMSPGETHYRDVYPCVWRLDDYLGYVEAQEFAELLTDVKVEIWRVDDFETPKPRAYTSNYIWPGCVSVAYAPVRDGTWLYDISACLDGVELTARATTSFYFRE